MIASKFRPNLTLEYMTTAHENKYFDRKSAGIKPSDLGQHICAFANADGGTLVIGINDKTLMIEGINSFGEDKINDLINAPKECCMPMPLFDVEYISVMNAEGQPDRILLMHIHSDPEQLIRCKDERTWLRIGDKSKEMRGDNLRSLEYAKNARHYEDEINRDALIEDLDQELLRAYQEHIGATDQTFHDTLKARGFIKRSDGKEFLTNAAVLLFAKNISEFYPNCRIRFVRYAGVHPETGVRINIVKDVNFEYPILRIIDKAKDFVATQLREFTTLDIRTSRFVDVPEYPEFTWQEGIVNAVAHREYALTGSFIKISMFDDRLEIESPGKLPNIVTVENIRETRFSRNSRIARVLTEFGWVRELNEGVKRIYEEMASFYLDDPVYCETDHSVQLTLKNNYVMRSLRQEAHARRQIGEHVWTDLDELEQKIIALIMNKGAMKTSELVKLTGKANGTIITRINHMIELGILKATGKSNDPQRKYDMA